MKNKKDPALDISAESNSNKHINYKEQEEKSRGEHVKDSKDLQKRMRRSASTSG
jgi:hypothetical protein